jgi:hypothetical protein
MWDPTNKTVHVALFSQGKGAKQTHPSLGNVFGMHRECTKLTQVRPSQGETIAAGIL